MDGFSRNVTSQVESANKKLNHQSSTLKKQSNSVNAIHSIVKESKNSQEDTNALLVKIQEIVAELQKELQNSIQAQNATSKKLDKLSNIDNSSEVGKSTNDALETIFTD